ncbi:FAD-dependent oxidoreductase domain-containing protein 2 [Gouania willdenowi]|uniref:FAD-dependent oxidoreductase domain-containing protein 2 n=1 Tax=Gouania willdenowi TaxID=441366 RepID=A0A8C5DST2_GOUWI|nr:FAD-dependent oxidoreductase domain-containing protein 2 [Gouania willdenowi]XP_028311712.1 FAD-dependent oxidoreductase domain-containing protein 2 [Gouania willdenowi]
MDPYLPCVLLSVLIVLVWSSSVDSFHYDYCVLGAGPAGLQMGHFLSKAKRDYIILERNSGPGSFFTNYPRHRKLISINKIHTGRRNREFNLRHDWNSLLSDKADLLFQRVSSEFYPPADAFPLYLSMFEKELGLRVRYGVDIGRIRAVQSDAGRSYILTDQHTTVYRCRILLVATGLWVPQKVEFVGSDLVEGYESISTDPDDYKNQAVLILGKGNSAFETAQSIMGRASRVHMLSSSPVRLAWQTHYVGDLRAVNNQLIDTYQLKSLDGLVEARLEKIAIARRQDEDVKRSGGKKDFRKKEKLYLTLKKFVQNTGERNSSDVTREELPEHHIDNFPMRKHYDRVIRCLGFRFNFSIFESSACPPVSDNAKGRLPGVTAWYEGKDTAALFVLGTAAHSRDYRSSAGGFVHGFRYLVQAVHRVLEYRYHSNLWPSTKLSTTQLQSWILKRLGEASGPYQMFGVIGDVVLLQGSHCEYIEEFLLQALPQFSSLSGHKVSEHGLIVIVMQYGKKKIDYLGHNRAETDWTKAWRSNFLHPVLYYYDSLPTEENMKLRPDGWPLPRPKAIHHIVEDFLTEWEGPLSHIQPLRHFLEHCLRSDLRTFFAETCFRSSLTHRKPPPFCQHGYLKQQGVHLPQLLQVSGLLLTEQEADTTFPNDVSPPGASQSLALKLDL